MINRVSINNFGVLQNLHWDNLQNINLIIGANGSGKTFLLKALYCSIRTIEDYQRGNDRRTESEILSDKLYWTFQPDKIGDLVSKSSTGPLSCEIAFDNREFRYEFGKDTTKKITNLTNRTMSRSSNSIYLPSKEVLSLFHIILESREQDHLFGFDDTYLDLVRALSLPRRGGKNYAEFADSRKSLEKILGGKVEYDETAKSWVFKTSTQKFSIGTTAEGIKKIAILDTLLTNRHLDTNSIIFIDEPESALHPAAISDFMNIVGVLADRGLQFFMASHSYFVIKKLALMARDKDISIPLISLPDNQLNDIQYSDLKHGLPDNSIINESIRLYEQEIEGAVESWI